MGKVTGLGGIFFKANDPTQLGEWYRAHLGLEPENGPVFFRWRHRDSNAPGTTVWALFEKITDYFGPGSAPFMINYRVDNLDAILTRLAAEGVSIDPRREDGQFGKFAWITDLEGNRIELWEPPAGQ
jgi:catechol 2,3-dioxygenase-like lactoylglutathione lyase family enzyme